MIKKEGADLAVRPLIVVVAVSYFRAAWAAARRAIGTRYGEQLT